MNLRTYFSIIFLFSSLVNSQLFCGDGSLTLGLGEQCDQGTNDPPPLNNGDGCSTMCQVEQGWVCQGASNQVCVPICGDGMRVGTESQPNRCDDGNTSEGDGCNGACQVEQGWNCSQTPSQCTPICGNGALHGSESCDDGNLNDGDGCSSNCLIESGFMCQGSGNTSCTAICGDGEIHGNELCDDGNSLANDGCSSSCTVELGWSCNNTMGTSSPTNCTEICGDGNIVGIEDCDDNNLDNADGCSATCQIESGFSCTSTPSVCSAGCGDNSTVGFEMCDDGNLIPNDGCSSSCMIETGWVCNNTATPSQCNEICGDGRIVGGEACDDSNSLPDDGCSSSCTIETGYSCVFQPSLCFGICGDGLQRGQETCDQANTATNDGCSDLCRIEQGWSCSGEPAICFEICGDGIVVGSEICDDGNVQDDDGCSSECTSNLGYMCSATQPSICREVCGDGNIIGAEECDDGNLDPNDGCSAVCTIENFENRPSSNTALVAVAVVAPVGLCIICCCALTAVGFFLEKKARQNKQSQEQIEFEEAVRRLQVPLLEDIELGRQLGAGQFGVVYEGTWNSNTKVALKSVKRSLEGSIQQELDLLIKLRHPNILMLFGLYIKDLDMFMVTELMNRGDLLNFLREEAEITEDELFHFVKQTATGMEHLHKLNILHRDLACRNILISDEKNYTIKIADFGLSRQLDDQDFYQIQNKAVPVRWTAPEVIEKLQHSKASDVWSFGVVVWEIYTRGAIPYAGLSNSKVLDKVKQGFRLTPPVTCPEGIAHLQNKCWYLEPSDRPQFAEITKALNRAENRENATPSTTSQHSPRLGNNSQAIPLNSNADSVVVHCAEDQGAAVGTMARNTDFYASESWSTHDTPVYLTGQDETPHNSSLLLGPSPCAKLSGSNDKDSSKEKPEKAPKSTSKNSSILMIQDSVPKGSPSAPASRGSSFLSYGSKRSSAEPSASAKNRSSVEPPVLDSSKPSNADPTLSFKRSSIENTSNSKRSSIEQNVSSKKSGVKAEKPSSKGADLFEIAAKIIPLPSLGSKRSSLANENPSSASPSGSSGSELNSPQSLLQVYTTDRF